MPKKITFLRHHSEFTPSDGLATYVPGQTITLPDDVADRLIDTQTAHLSGTPRPFDADDVVTVGELTNRHAPAGYRLAETIGEAFNSSDDDALLEVDLTTNPIPAGAYGSTGAWDAEAGEYRDDSGGWLVVAVPYDLDPEKDYSLRIRWTPPTANSSSASAYSLPSNNDTNAAKWHGLMFDDVAGRGTGVQEDWIQVGPSHSIDWALAHADGEPRMFLDFLPGSGVTSVTLFEGDAMGAFTVNGVTVGSSGRGLRVPSLEVAGERVMFYTERDHNMFKPLTRTGPAPTIWSPFWKGDGTWTEPERKDWFNHSPHALRVVEPGIYQVRVIVKFVGVDMTKRALWGRLAPNPRRELLKHAFAAGTAAESTFEFIWSDVRVTQDDIASNYLFQLALGWSPFGAATTSVAAADLSVSIFQIAKQVG